MKFEIKTEPVCVVLIAVPAYMAIVVVTLGTGMQAQDLWLPITIIVAILATGITYISPKYLIHEGRCQRRAEPRKTP
jgi:hypothetical protein